MFLQPWVVRRLLSAMLYKRMRRVVVFSFVGSWARETPGKSLGGVQEYIDNNSFKQIIINSH